MAAAYGWLSKPETFDVAFIVMRRAATSFWRHAWGMDVPLAA